MIRDLVSRAVTHGGLPLDDVLALALPLLEQVRLAHEAGHVAPLRGIDALAVDEHRLTYDSVGELPPTLHRAAIAAAEAPASAVVDVRRGADRHLDLSAGNATSAQIDTDPAGPPRARFVAGWQRWEHLVEHHDELTDIGSLGELLVALCCGLDLTENDDVTRLASHHRNLFALAPSLPPVVAAVLTSMIEPQRHRRAQDLGEVAQRLATYRDQPEDFDLDRVLTPGSLDLRGAVLTHLRDRLFDLTRRNPLLHFRTTQSTLNLTQASVPLVLDVRSIRPEQLFTWSGPASRRLVKGRPAKLGSIVRWDDAPYAAASLDALIATARRDRAEYGQDQLRLVVAFLRWHNVKDDPDTPIWSPLVLAPVKLTKQRGVSDAYWLELAEPVAEVNPVLRHELRETYGFSLPENVDLGDDDPLEGLRATIEQEARRSQPGVAVSLVTKPRIELIRSRAQTALQSYRRRRGSTRPMIGRRHYAYSYTRPGWVPLGIQIFRDQVLRTPLPMAVELGDAPAPRQQVVDQEMFSVDSQGETNPYTWEVDLCSVTLANFNYRTLSLVRDYDALLAEPVANQAFDELFSTAPRQQPEPGAEIAVDDRYLVVPADGSQLAALGQARAGDNFVIQGPPGTGKSQTITNLIADYLARGKRVLFVCQKRAALDVVHARLRSQGLDEICTLIHDSQADKKAFVHALRETYETWLQPAVPGAPAADSLEELESRRTAMGRELAAVLDELATYEHALLDGVPGERLTDVVDRLVALRASAWGAQLGPAERRLLPDSRSWRTARPAIDVVAAALVRAGEPDALARSAVRLIDRSALTDTRADTLVAERAAAAARHLGVVRRMLEAGPDPDGLDLDQVREIAALHALLDPLPDVDRSDVLRQRSTTSGELREAAEQHSALMSTVSRAADAAYGWQQPQPSAEDARSALAVAQRKEHSLLRVFSGEWRRVRELFEDGYHDPQRQVVPTVSEAWGLLVAQHDAVAAERAFEAAASRRWGQSNVAGLAARMIDVRRLEVPLAAWRDAIAGPDAMVRESLDDLAPTLADLDAATAGVLVLDGPLTTAEADLTTLASSAGQALVRAVAPGLARLPDDVLLAMRRLDAPPDSLEYAVLTEALEQQRASAPILDRVDGRRLADLLGTVSEVLPGLQRANARVVTARLRERFVAAVEHSQRSVTSMDEAGRHRKKTWSTGRRELEHEFGKVRAYKSIRQLASADSGAVVAGMRPVWLMSPSSLSDTLPLESSFDVVIYDEASQVPVEEAVPALFRAAQVIVVGDRMQLPPTQYFRSRVESGGAEGDDEETPVGVVLEADSFLAVSSVRLPSTMLLWHYRSRYEALIGFSNAAFYDGRLATVPDREPPAAAASSALTVAAPAEDRDPDPAAVEAALDAVLARSISMLRVTDGVYTLRTNPAEAGWIAALVRALLARGTGLTIGVVAFSEAQQGEIERALDRLAKDDPVFAEAYEAELNREDDGQSVGLFVKNLENVQGDERDVIIMSVCYGPAPDGRMRMGFGPINNAGGEKRLNVIFSRSKSHMVLVSSIDHTMITNTYNDGANTLKGFLKYAAAVSDGDVPVATEVLRGLRVRERPGLTRSGATPTASVVEQIAGALRDHGLEVAVDIGQSGFRCDLAIRRPGEAAYTTAVLVDHATRLDRAPLDERRLTQPTALAAAGWRVEQVPATEWLERPDVVIERLLASSAG